MILAGLAAVFLFTAMVSGCYAIDMRSRGDRFGYSDAVSLALVSIGCAVMAGTAAYLWGAR